MNDEIDLSIIEAMEYAERSYDSDAEDYGCWDE